MNIPPLEPRTTSRMVAAAVRHHRERLGMTRRLLASLINEMSREASGKRLAPTLTEDDIEAIEEVQRTVSVDELVALAFVLETTPDEMLCNDLVDVPEASPWGSGLPATMGPRSVQRWLRDEIPMHPYALAKHWRRRAEELEELPDGHDTSERLTLINGRVAELRYNRDPEEPDFFGSDFSPETFKPWPDRLEELRRERELPLAERIVRLTFALEDYPQRVGSAHWYRPDGITDEEWDIIEADREDKMIRLAWLKQRARGEGVDYRTAIDEERARIAARERAEREQMDREYQEMLDDPDLYPDPEFD